MFVATGERARARSVALWCAATAAAAGVALITVPTLAAIPSLLGSRPAFAEVLVTGCAVGFLMAAGWLWAITTDVVVGVLRARGGVVVRRPGAVRLLLLAACGVVALSSPATADDRQPVSPQSLSGLPLPDRATSSAVPPVERSAPDNTVRKDQVRVRPGDSLWTIAAELLGPRATVVDIADYWHRIYDRNLAVIGPDPDLILPGQLLELPSTRRNR